MAPNPAVDLKTREAFEAVAAKLDIPAFIDYMLLNFVAAIDAHVSWGWFDYRRKGEGMNDGYQSPPVNWGISSERKRGFFRLLTEITGSQP